MSAPDDEQVEDFGALLEEFEQKSAASTQRGVKVGETVSGTVISIGADSVFVDLGGKSEGVLDLDQVCDREGNVTVSVGDTVEARVVEAGGRSGSVILRRQMGRGPEARSELVQAFEHQIPVEGTVSATNKGGFEVQVAGVRAFCPVSQIDIRFVEDPEVFLGQKLSFRITKLEAGRGGRPNIVLSRRALLEEERAEQAEETRARLEVGAVLRGVVTSVKDYGAFVDLGGIEGMLHISELGHSRVEHPSEVLRQGQSLEVQVVKIEQTGDAKRPEKIGLSLKSLERDPWDDVVARLGPGSSVSGAVVRIQPFGAFVELAPGVEGLIHISEMGAGRRLNSPREVVSVGQNVEVTVLSVDQDKRRIGLSMDAASRNAAAAEEAEAVATHAKSKETLGTFADLLGDKLRKS